VVFEKDNDGAQRVRTLSKETTIGALATVLWDLSQLVMSTARNDEELQALSDYWNENKPRLERILRKNRVTRG